MFTPPYCCPREMYKIKGTLPFADIVHSFAFGVQLTTTMQQLLDSSSVLPRSQRNIQAGSAGLQRRFAPRWRHDSVLHPPL
jgi:hypothetical protein